MEESQYIYDTLLFNQAPAAVEYFNSRAPSCFASEEDQVQLSIYRECSDSGTAARSNGGGGVPSESEPHRAASEQCLSKDFMSPLPFNLLSIHSTKELAEFADVKMISSSRKLATDIFTAFAI